MLKISRPACKVKGKVYPAPRVGMKHKEIIAEKNLPADAVRGFVTSADKFVGREEGAKIAIAAGQVPSTVRFLHSEDLPEYKAKHKR